MKFKLARLLLDLNLSDIEKKSGVDTAAISRYENGVIHWTKGARGKKICETLGIDPQWAFEDWRLV